MPKQKKEKPQFEYGDYDPVKTYNKKTVFIKQLVVWKLETLFKSAQRKMQGRAKFVGRRESTSSTDIHWSMLWIIHHVLDKLPKGGYILHPTPYKDTKREKEFVRWEFECWCESRFVSLMEKFGIKDVRDWMKRELTGGRCADVVFAEEKPFF